MGGSWEGVVEMGICGDAGYFVFPETAAFLAEGIAVSPGFGVRKSGCKFQLLHLLAVWASFFTILNLSLFYSSVK